MTLALEPANSLALIVLLTSLQIVVLVTVHICLADKLAFQMSLAITTVLVLSVLMVTFWSAQNASNAPRPTPTVSNATSIILMNASAAN